jgi:hypothetical protein
LATYNKFARGLPILSHSWRAASDTFTRGLAHYPHMGGGGKLPAILLKIVKFKICENKRHFERFQRFIS